MARSTHKVNESRTFGIEIEAYGVPMTQLAQALTAAGVPCAVQGYNHTTCATWKLVPDGSIQGAESFELVSPPLRGQAGLAQLAIVCRVLGEQGAQVNKSCGLHVHHDANDLTLVQWKNFVKYYVKYEQALDSLMPASRRAGANSYCKSIRGAFASVRAAFTAIDRATTLQELARLVFRYDRYYKVNMMAFWRHGTVEVRHHSGTVEYEKIAAWVSLTQGLLYKAIARQASPTAVDGDLAGALDRAGVNAQTVTFYRARQAALAS